VRQARMLDRLLHKVTRAVSALSNPFGGQRCADNVCRVSTLRTSISSFFDPIPHVFAVAHVESREKFMGRFRVGELESVKRKIGAAEGMPETSSFGGARNLCSRRAQHSA